MPANKQELAIRASKALQLKLQGKSYKDIGEIQNTSTSTARRDVAYAMLVAKDGSIENQVQDLIAQQFANTQFASELEGEFLEDIDKKSKEKDIDKGDIEAVNKIKTSSQKIFSFLSGENAKTDGGEKENSLKILSDADLLKFTQ
jgi:hypothetical protein